MASFKWSPGSHERKFKIDRRREQSSYEPGCLSRLAKIVAISITGIAITSVCVFEGVKFIEKVKENNSRNYHKEAFFKGYKVAVSVDAFGNHVRVYGENDQMLIHAIDNFPRLDGGRWGDDQFDTLELIHVPGDHPIRELATLETMDKLWLEYGPQPQ